MKLDKQCERCLGTKPIEEFYAKNQRYCISCYQAKCREWYEANKEKRALTIKRWAERNKARKIENDKAWHLRNPGKQTIYQTKWNRANPGKVLAVKHNRRAREKNLPGSHTASDVLALWEQQKHRCAVQGCTNPITDSGKHRYHIDHVIPLAKGGSNHHGNLQILCQKHNSQKSDRDPIEWAQRYCGRLFI